MTADAKRYYAMLGVDPECSDEEIRLAFRRRAKELHPDSETGSASAFIHLKKAYDTLADPARRARYDRARGRRFRGQSQDLPLRRTRAPRPGGISLARYAVAFLFMAGLSYGAIEMLIDFSDVPAGSTVRPAGPVAAGSVAAGGRPKVAADERVVERDAGTGFFDPTSPDGTPRRNPPPHAAVPPDRNALWPTR